MLLNSSLQSLLSGISILGNLPWTFCTLKAQCGWYSVAISYVTTLKSCAGSQLEIASLLPLCWFQMSTGALPAVMKFPVIQCHHYLPYCLACHVSSQRVLWRMIQSLSNNPRDQKKKPSLMPDISIACGEEVIYFKRILLKDANAGDKKKCDEEMGEQHLGLEKCHRWLMHISMSTVFMC